jgi:hypothetical protein
LKEPTGYNYFGYALEPVPFARKGINDVYFDGRVLLDVRDRSRRANIGEDEVTIVPNCDGALGERWAYHQGKQSPKARRCSAATRFISAVSLAGASFISPPGFDQKSLSPVPGGAACYGRGITRLAARQNDTAISNASDPLPI